MRVLGLLPILLVLPLAACGGAEPAADPPRSPTSSTSSAPPPTVTVDGASTGVECLQKIRTADLGYWESTVTASAPVRITRIEAVGHGVRADGGLLVPVIGGSVNSTGISDWPPPVDRVLRRDVAWQERVPLVGADVPVQRAMLPMLHLRGVGGGRLDAVVLHFRGVDGQTGSTRIPFNLRFSRTTC